MGFSFNDIDLPYIKKIVEVNKNISDTDWTLFCYSEGEDENIISRLNRIGIEREQFLPTKWWY